MLYITIFEWSKQMISQSDNREDETQVPNMFLEINNTYCWTVSTGIKKFDDLLKWPFFNLEEDS